MLFVIVGVEADDVGRLAVTEPFEALTSLGIPQLHLTIIATRQKPAPIVRERDILDGLNVTVERSKTISMRIYVPKL